MASSSELDGGSWLSAWEELAETCSCIPSAQYPFHPFPHLPPFISEHQGSLCQALCQVLKQRDEQDTSSALGFSAQGRAHFKHVDG